MIECGYFYDEEFDRYNGRVIDHHEINATFQSEDEMKESICATWNSAYPEDPKVVEDFHYTEVAPW